jgi:hypothetical protein
MIEDVLWSVSAKSGVSILSRLNDSPVLCGEPWLSPKRLILQLSCHKPLVQITGVDVRHRLLLFPSNKSDFNDSQ